MRSTFSVPSDLAQPESERLLLLLDEIPAVTEDVGQPVPPRQPPMTVAEKEQFDHIKCTDGPHIPDTLLYARDKYQRTLLMLAARDGHVSVDILLRNCTPDNLVHPCKSVFLGLTLHGDFICAGGNCQIYFECCR